ncbi:MAG: hypothetical protein WBV60_10175 [Terriglobales bacterium]
MSHLYFKKIGLIAGGIAVSIALAVIMEGLTSMNSPGFIIQGYLLPGHGAVHPLSRCTPFSKGALGSPRDGLGQEDRSIDLPIRSHTPAR